MKISVVISAYNEQDKIKDCLDSVKDLADEIILVDNTSVDKTAEIAKIYTKKVYVRPNDPVMLNRNKNFGFTKAIGEWILSLDADERTTPELAREIKSAINNKRSRQRRGSPKAATINGYEMPRKNIIFGKWIQHSLWWPDYNLRLFRRGKGQFPQKHVHEKLEVEGEVGQLENPLVHHNYQTISQFIKKMDTTYTESEVENFLKSGQSINWYDAVRWPVADFVKTFFAQKGYQDGLHGLVLSQLQAFYALIFFAKVWERKEKFSDLFNRHSDQPPSSHSELDSESVSKKFLAEVIKEFQRAAREIRYWIYEVLMSQNPALKLYYKLRRKLR